MMLLAERWEFEWTTKRFKAYLNPEGTEVAARALIDKILEIRQEGRTPETAELVFGWAPHPSVFIRLEHFTEDQKRCLMWVLSERGE